MTIGIIDYGAGNLLSVSKAVAVLADPPKLVTTPEAVLAADRLILPGVGAAGEAMARLRQAGLDEALTEAVRERGRPLLGICLGMQLLAETLEEFGTHKGLGWIEGRVVSLRGLVAPDLAVPQMGWNQVEPTALAGGFFARPETQRSFYFAHSFTLRTAREDLVAGWVDYGVPLIAAVRFDSVFAVQCHPEKSQINGERLLEAFLDWSP